MRVTVTLDAVRKHQENAGANRTDDADSQRRIAHAVLAPAVGQCSTHVHPETAEADNQQPECPSHFRRRPSVYTLEKRRHPSSQTIGARRLKDHSHRDSNDRLPADQHLLENVAKGQCGCPAVGGPEDVPPHRLSHGGNPCRNEEPGHPYEEERQTP